MGELESSQSLAAFAVLLQECFDGREEGKRYTWFVEGREGIFDAIESLDAVAASRKPGAGCSSVVGHASHILYALRLANTVHGGPKPSGDWEASWNIQGATEEEWVGIRSAIHREYEAFQAWVRSNADWTDGELLVAAFALLPHMAFHLGAIRQILKFFPSD